MAKDTSHPDPVPAGSLARYRQRIKQLESILGVRLFDRLRRDIRLTPEGNRLLNHADLLIAEWRKARQEVAPGGARPRASGG